MSSWALEESAAEKGRGVGEKAEGGSSIMLGPGGVAPGEIQPSPAQMLAWSLCWNKDSLSCFQELPQEPPPS